MCCQLQSIRLIRPITQCFNQNFWLFVCCLWWMKIRNSAVPILKTTHLVYNEIEKEILALIQHHPTLLSRFPVYILGGIVINTDETLPNYFSQKTFRKL